MIVMVMLGLLRKASELVTERIGLLHGGQDRAARDLAPGRRNERRAGIVLTKDRNRIGKTGIRDAIGMRKDDASGVLDLIAEELTEVFHIHLAFSGVNDRRCGVKDDLIRADVANGTDNVTELTDTRRLDQNTVGRKLCEHLFKCVAEIADEAAADAAGIHFGDLDARVAHKAAVDADLSELVFDQNELFAVIRLCNQLFDQGRFTCTEKARKNVNFRHFSCPLYKTNFILKYYIPEPTSCQAKKADSGISLTDFQRKITEKARV